MMEMCCCSFQSAVVDGGRLFRKATSAGMTLLWVAATELLIRKKELRRGGEVTLVSLQVLSKLLPRSSSSTGQGENMELRLVG